MNARSGYTLIELLVAVILATLLLSLSVGAFHTWGASSAMEKARTVLRSDLIRARSYALARLCITRVRIQSADEGTDTFVTIERLNMDDRNKWYPLSVSNRIERVRATTMDVYFRTDGSCTTEEALIDSAASFEGCSILLAPYKGDRLQMIHIDEHTGLLSDYSYAYDPDNETEEGNGSDD